MENDIKITAEYVRRLPQTVNILALNNVLEEIKKQAVSGQRVLHVNYLLADSVKTELKQRGFDIEDAPSIAIQREGFYHWVRW